MKPNSLVVSHRTTPLDGAPPRLWPWFRAIWAGIAFALLACPTAQAALVDHGTSTLDTIASREWLDLTESQHLSYNDMVGAANDCNPTCSTGTFAGWTFAAESDVKGFMADAGLAPYSITTNGNSTLRGAAASFRSLVGLTSDFLFQSNSEGISRTSAGPDQVLMIRAFEARDLICLHCGTAFNSAGTSSAAVSALVPYALIPANGFGPGGVWLYQTVGGVPEPETVAMMLAGLCLLGVTMRRKQR